MLIKSEAPLKAVNCNPLNNSKTVLSCVYRHIRNYYLSNSKAFQDGNGNGIFGEINSNDFQDGNWEPMEMKDSLWTPRR